MPVMSILKATKLFEQCSEKVHLRAKQARVHADVCARTNTRARAHAHMAAQVLNDVKDELRPVSLAAGDTLVFLGDTSRDMCGSRARCAAALSSAATCTALACNMRPDLACASPCLFPLRAVPA